MLSMAPGLRTGFFIVFFAAIGVITPMFASSKLKTEKHKQKGNIMAANANLHKAKDAKNDEFYTQLTDVSKELMHYKPHFKDKVVFCNCDDPTYSAFWKYFHLNFSALGLKKLISTHYDKNEPTYKMEYEGGDDNDVEVGVKTPLEGNGDFRNKECLDLLDESDIVVTNPPFSLFREYVAVLMEHDKKFIIWGNNNAITYKEFFPLLKDNKVWLGYMANQTCVFRLSDDYEKWDEKITAEKNDGHKYGKCPAISVFTNLDIPKRHEKLILWKNYTPEEYPTYDNYDAINVDKVSEIPVDYEPCWYKCSNASTCRYAQTDGKEKNEGCEKACNGVMGVPITFLDKHNPEQFKTLGCTANPESNSVNKKARSEKALSLIKQGRLRGARCVGGNSNIFIDEENYVHVLYHRLLICQKRGD